MDNVTKFVSTYCGCVQSKKIKKQSQEDVKECVNVLKNYLPINESEMSEVLQEFDNEVQHKVKKLENVPEEYERQFYDKLSTHLVKKIQKISPDHDDLIDPAFNGLNFQFKSLKKV